MSKSARRAKRLHGEGQRRWLRRRSKLENRQSQSLQLFAFVVLTASTSTGQLRVEGRREDRSVAAAHRGASRQPSPTGTPTKVARLVEVTGQAL
jgi:hypothetical protein